MKKILLILIVLNLGYIASASETVSEIYKYEDYNNIFGSETREKDLIANNSVTYQFDMVAPVFNVDVIGKTNELEVRLIIEILKNASNWTEPVPRNVYKYFNAWIEQPKRIDKLKFKYFVDNSWMNESNISVDDIKLYKWADKQWIPLETKIIDTEDDRVYFESITNVSTHFAIVENKDKKEVIEKIVENSEDEEYEEEIIQIDDEDFDDLDEDLGTKKSPGFGIVIVILIFISLYCKKTKK